MIDIQDATHHVTATVYRRMTGKGIERIQQIFLALIYYDREKRGWKRWIPYEKEAQSALRIALMYH
jgi:hypothetical protein